MLVLRALKEERDIKRRPSEGHLSSLVQGSWENAGLFFFFNLERILFYHELLKWHSGKESACSAGNMGSHGFDP